MPRDRFFASTTVAAIFNAQPLVLPIVASAFVSFVTSGMGVAYAAILLTRALGRIVRNVRPVHSDQRSPDMADAGSCAGSRGGLTGCEYAELFDPDAPQRGMSGDTVLVRDLGT